MALLSTPTTRTAEAVRVVEIRWIDACLLKVTSPQRAWGGLQAVGAAGTPGLMKSSRPAAAVRVVNPFATGGTRGGTGTPPPAPTTGQIRPRDY
jgi:hypothetical protein